MSSKHLEMAEEGAKAEDTRYSWIGYRVLSSLKVKPEAYTRFLASENRY